MSDDVLNSIENVAFINNLKNKFKKFILESKQLIEIVNTKDLNEVENYIKKCSILFKGPCGVRHVDFIAHKDE